MNKKAKAAIGIAVRAGIVLIIIFFIARIIYKNWSSLSNYEWQVNSYLLSFSVLLLLFAFYMMAGGWYIILTILKEKITLFECLRIYVISQLGRYIPGKVFMFVGRAIMAQEKGINQNTTILSIFMEALLSLAGSVIAILALFYISASKIVFINSKILLLLLIIIPLLLHPVILRKGFSIIKKFKIFHKFGSIELKLKFHQILLLILYYAIIWSLVGLGFYFFSTSISKEIPITFLFEISGTFVLAWLIGFISVLSPGGIGVREGVLAFTLTNILPAALASILALSSRIWFTVVEVLSVILLVGIGSLPYINSRLKLQRN